MVKRLILLSLSCAAVLLSACATFNNDKRIEDLTSHMLNRTKGQFLCVMEPGPAHATSGFSIFLEGKQVAFYKYDIKKKKAKKKLDWIKENKCLYIWGIKYPAVVNGSFVMIDYEVNPKKDLLLDAFMDF